MHKYSGKYVGGSVPLSGSPAVFRYPHKKGGSLPLNSGPAGLRYPLCGENPATPAQERIGAFTKFGSKLGLTRMNLLSEKLGRPERRLRVVHVAGTNGKGSVCRYIYEVLLACGYTAGIFTSPFVEDFRERIEANGSYIPEEALETLTDRVIAAAHEILAETGESPTEFELITAIGLLYFAEQKLDFAVLEVGLGGGGDSTNIVEAPLVSVITSISLDHTDRLGTTETEIATEKAGIIKRGRPVICGASGDAARVIAKKAYELGAPLTNAHVEWIQDVREAKEDDSFASHTEILVNMESRAVDQDGADDGQPGVAFEESAYQTLRAADRVGFRLCVSKLAIEGAAFSLEIHGRRYDDIRISMVGKHQIENAACALAALESLREHKFVDLSLEGVRSGMRAARLGGRFQVVQHSPLVILDGAHNPAGAGALADTVKTLLPKKRILVVCAVMRDKDCSGVIQALAKFATDFIATESTNERSMPAEELATLMRAATGTKEQNNGVSSIHAKTGTSEVCIPEAAQITPIPAVSKAYKTAMASANNYEALIFAGSLYLISDVIGLSSPLLSGSKS